MKHPLVIAHRGARSLAPENTLSAVLKAVEAGADMWELDVSVSADGQLYLMHDDTLERTTNVKKIFPERRPWTTADLTLAEIRQLDSGSWFVDEDPFEQIAVGNISAEDQERYRGELVPTLREALEFSQRVQLGVNIEIKEQPDKETARLAVEKTVALVTELGMDDGAQVVISSFEHDYLQQVRALSSRIPVQVLTSRVIPDLASYLSAFGTDTVNPKNSVWDVQQLRKLSDQGVLINVWTVNDEAEMTAFIDARVHGIITDFPQVLRQILPQADK